MTVATINCEALRRRLEQGETIIDGRPQAAFNGWTLRGERRGGHIPGAIALPMDWQGEMTEADLSAYLRDRGATPEGSTTIVGYAQKDLLKQVN